MRVNTVLPFAIATLIIVTQCPAQQGTVHDSVNRQSQEEIPYEFVPVESEPQVADGDTIMKHLVYPEEARKLGQTGKVSVRFRVETDGHVSRAVIEQGKYELLNAAAIDAIKKTRFSPAVQNGQPIAVWTSETIEFK